MFMYINLANICDSFSLQLLVLHVQEGREGRAFDVKAAYTKENAVYFEVFLREGREGRGRKGRKGL